MKVPLIERLLFGLLSPDDERVRKGADVDRLAADSDKALRRVERLIRVARVDAEIDALRGRDR